MAAVSATAYGWKAALDLGFARQGERTVLAHRRHVGPLIVQRPFYPEGNVCHTYVVHPPGGVVGGDELQLDVTLQEGSHALLTTPASAKFYRSAGAAAHQAQHFHVQQSTLEWLPQDTIFYPGANVRSETRIDVTGKSSFIGWEVVCLGLPARTELFESGALRLNLELWVDGSPRFLDRLHVLGGSDALQAPWAWDRHHCLGTMLAYPAKREWLDQLRGIHAGEVQLAFTIVDDVLVTRMLSAHADRARVALTTVWRVLRPLLLNRSPAEPRIWAT